MLVILLAKNILGNNSKTRNLPDIGFAMESQESKQLSFCIVFSRNKWQNFEKKAKYPISGPFSPKFWQKWIFTEVSLCHMQKVRKNKWANSHWQKLISKQRWNTYYYVTSNHGTIFFFLWKWTLHIKHKINSHLAPWLLRVPGIQKKVITKCKN